MINPLEYGQSQWQQILHDYDASLRSRMGELVQAHSRGLAENFYQQMMDLPEARRFLEHEQVNRQLMASMTRWLEQVFSVHEVTQIPAAVERQFEVGRVHARINLPINLVSAGARLHKKCLLEHVTQRWPVPADWLKAATYLVEVIDLSLELMSLAFVSKSERKSRAAEAYRLHNLGMNLSVERERQRASLLDWSQELVFALHQHETPPTALRHAEFGLWFHHQAVSVFEGAPELEQIEHMLRNIDLQLLPALWEAREHRTAMAESMAALQRELRALSYLLATLFDRFIELEHGRDTLTRLLDRRFLPAVLNREVRLAMRGGGEFSVILFDVDWFKQVNDNHGHEGGDMVLQQVASLVAGSVRSSDFCFRYGGEELLVVLVEAGADNALAVAEKVRDKLMNSELSLPDGKRTQVTLSGGVATFDGHPDYDQLIKRADRALYRAKAEGRNRCLPG
ncbi:GGDEF domain-containing protein [Oceanimonas sp. CHS3-5]|uniref:GGDEF domain-containing protein n=1 Tax=Oceanimonas sp. CHS3-5 TaxID=3068186 RepID=UPI00273F871C|nr:GGDEF domain-containing protein [Oceanimonas sp. CHS3-5]MDP5292332.1 GGDEF domain-containing protein [Oceanimonas sp. CHS3-5]